METDMDELDNLFAAVKEGRDLSDDEKALLRKVADDVEPKPDPEPTKPVELEKLRARLEEIGEL
jgi:hypothetical protein